MSKQLRLLTLSLKNFKGVRLFTLDTRGENAKVFGDNATGKTTIFDSFIYLLFDKDSQNKKDFSIKTLVDGKELHNLEHEVEAKFLFDGSELTLRKVYMEKWTKKRGYPTPEFTGHETNYYIDGVPVKKKEYAEKVDSIVQEDIFKLLTSPSFFNEQVKWQVRRKTLLELCGDISDEDVIISETSLAKLPSILNGRTIENHRKIIGSRRSEINKEMEKIPVRIDEIKRSLPEVDGVDKAGLEKEISQLNNDIDEKMTLINNIRNGKAISDKEKTIKELEIKLLEIKMDHESGSKDKVYQLKARIQEEQSNVNILQSKIDNLNHRKQMNNREIQSLDESKERLKKEWFAVDQEQFSHESDCSCPTCGQALPDEQVHAAKEKALASFNKSKSDRLEEIKRKGISINQKKEEILVSIANMDKDIEKITGQLDEKKELFAKFQEQLMQLESTIVDIMDNPEYSAKLQEKQNVVAEIKELKNDAEHSMQAIYAEIYEMKAKRDQLQSDVGKFSVVDQSQNRITELELQERDLAAEFEKLEGELYLTEEFIRTKVNLLTEKINSKFKYARFKLFETQINGGLTEVCETLYDGVPYSSGLNNAAKINVGLDIINTLSEHYGFYAPIFVDNSEAVTRLIDTESQVISLVVSEQDKQLRIERMDNLLTVDLEVV